MWLGGHATGPDLPTRPSVEHTTPQDPVLGALWGRSGPDSDEDEVGEAHEAAREAEYEAEYEAAHVATGCPSQHTPTNSGNMTCDASPHSLMLRKGAIWVDLGEIISGNLTSAGRPARGLRLVRREC